MTVSGTSAIKIKSNVVNIGRVIKPELHSRINNVVNSDTIFQSGLFHLKKMFNKSFKMESYVKFSLLCEVCKVAVAIAQDLVKLGVVGEEIGKMLFVIKCDLFEKYSARVCKGLAEMFGPEAIYVLKHATFGSDEICSFVLGDSCGDSYSRNHDWHVVFPPVPKPPVRNLKRPQENSPTIKVLQISDTHFDPYYQEGANANCNEPLCCRASSGPVLTPGDRAGRWGDYRSCDTAKRTIYHMLKHIADTHPDIEYILWTGDLSAHDVWNQTKKGNLKIIEETVAQMSLFFPGVPIFPAIGNHESVPIDSFPPPHNSPPDVNMAWLYNTLDRLWRRWLPAGVSRTVRRGAFYSVLVRPGLRIISVNGNYCSHMNWWLTLNSTDPVSELQWLINELQKAELRGEKVHIIGHIPPGFEGCVKVWSRNFNEIVNRYEATITAQFYGHTHHDEFEVFYDLKDLKRATSIAYVGPSVTPFVHLNPGYRIYYVDGDHKATTRLVVDHETWIMNLDKANKVGYPTWYMLYSARDAYSMKALRPQDWDKFISKMACNDDAFNLYYKHYWKDSPVRGSCDEDCRKDLVCDARSGRSHDRRALCGYDTDDRLSSYPPQISHWWNLEE
ncbi:calcineurin-like phosphoesterase domain-containing protein [Phthorimaea operculella]|nr:calcineurin-like phosphoesterase domain-containing protein [Phthorimaea operculella]